MFRTIRLQLFLPLRPFKKTVNIRRIRFLHALRRQRGAAAKHLLKPLTAQRCSHRLNNRTMEPWNQKSQIAQEYGLLPADARQQ